MTLEEALIIAGIVGTTDNACSCCVGSLVEKLNSAFPKFKWVDHPDEIVRSYFNFDGKQLTKDEYEKDYEGYEQNAIKITVEEIKN